MVDLVAQWLKCEAEVVEPFVTPKVQILSWSHYVFFAYVFIITFSQFCFFFLYIGFSDHLFKAFCHIF